MAAAPLGGEPVVRVRLLLRLEPGDERASPQLGEPQAHRPVLPELGAGNPRLPHEQLLDQGLDPRTLPRTPHES